MEEDENLIRFFRLSGFFFASASNFRPHYADFSHKQTRPHICIAYICDHQNFTFCKFFAYAWKLSGRSAIISSKGGNLLFHALIWALVWPEIPNAFKVHTNFLFNRYYCFKLFNFKIFNCKGQFYYFSRPSWVTLSWKVNIHFFFKWVTVRNSHFAPIF